MGGILSCLCTVQCSAMQYSAVQRRCLSLVPFCFFSPYHLPLPSMEHMHAFRIAGYVSGTIGREPAHQRVSVGGLSKQMPHFNFTTEMPFAVCCADYLYSLIWLCVCFSWSFE